MNGQQAEVRSDALSGIRCLLTSRTFPKVARCDKWRSNLAPIYVYVRKVGYPDAEDDVHEHMADKLFHHVKQPISSD